MAERNELHVKLQQFRRFSRLHVPSGMNENKTTQNKYNIICNVGDVVSALIGIGTVMYKGIPYFGILFVSIYMYILVYYSY